MLKIVVPKSEDYDPKTSEFISVPECVLTLEHSLISVAKWESRWKKSFLSCKKMTLEETIDYVKCMTLTNNVSNLVYDHLTTADFQKIFAYINDPMTATTFTDRQNRAFGREVITAEIIYYWMVALQIPFECQKWHLNRLMTLIRVVSIKQAPSKKMSRKDSMAQNRALNAARRRANNSKG